MCVPGSSQLSQPQQKVVCRLWKWVEGSESGKKGTAWLLVWVTCVKESCSVRFYGASLSFSLSCISVWHFGFAWFFSISFYLLFHIFFPLCFYVPSPLFIFFLTPPFILLSFKFILFPFGFRNVYSVSLNFLTYFFTFSFSSLLFFLNCFSSFLLCLIYTTLLFSALPPFPSLPPKFSLCYSLSLVAGAAAAAIRDTPGGLEWGGGWWCWGGAVPHEFLPPCEQEEEGSACAGLGTMVPVNRMGEFYLNVGMSHEN